MLQGGFTLIELIIVSGIIAVLSGAAIAGWRSGDADLLLQRSAHKLAQDIRRVGEMAMSAKEIGGSVPPGGYGVYFRFPTENSSYTLYADRNGNERYDNPDTAVEVIYLEQGIYIQSISGNNLSINFKPPNPTIRMDGQNQVLITLSLQSNPSKFKRVRINNAGLIEVE